jgi:hypothetical protein
VRHPAQPQRSVAYEGVRDSHTWDKVADQLYGSLPKAGVAAKAPEYSPEWERAFQAQFQRVFELSFDGKFACDTGDDARGIPLLEEVLRLNPEHPQVKQELAPEEVARPGDWVRP